MRDHSSENYLDQLLNSMDDGAAAQGPEREMDGQNLSSFERELFGEPQTRTARIAKGEEDFLREFEEEILKDEIPDYTNEISSELERENHESIDRELQNQDVDSSIEGMISHMNDLEPPIADISQDEADALVDPDADFAGEIPVMAMDPQQNLEAAMGAFDNSMSDQQEPPLAAMPEIPLTEDGEVNLAGGDQDLGDLLAGEDMADLQDLLAAGEGDSEQASSEDIDNFAADEMMAQEQLLNGEEPEEGKKKGKGIKGFFAKLSKIFFGDDEEEEQQMTSLGDGFADVSQLSEENEMILRELEGAGGGDEGKKKKDKKKKEKKPKKEKPKKEKPPKEPKPKKPKKEKPPKEKDNTPPLPKGPVIAILIMVGSLFGLVMIGTNLLGYQVSVDEAKNLFKQEAYQESYEKLNGYEIKEKDEPLYLKLQTLAPVSSEYETYLVFVTSGKRAMALDSLICAYGRYNDNITKAQEYDCVEELANLGAKVSDALLTEFDMTGEEALEIYEAGSRKQYSKLFYKKLDELGIEY